MSKQCVICGNKIGMFSNSFQIMDGSICANCIHDVSKVFNYKDPISIMQTLKLSQMSTSKVLDQLNSYHESPSIAENKADNTVTDSKELISKNFDDQIKVPNDEFDINRAVDVGGLAADFTSRIVMTSLSGFFTTNQQLYYFKDITGYKPTIEGREVKKHHGIARAATGGILFGGAGAIVGAMTGGKRFDVVSKISITVFLSNGDTFGATMLSDEKKADSLMVKGAQQQLDQWCNLLDRIINDNQIQPSQQNTSAQLSDADEIRKYKSLLDDGIISQEEFDKKKNELLGM